MRDIRLDATASPIKESPRQRRRRQLNLPDFIPQVRAESANGGQGDASMRGHAKSLIASVAVATLLSAASALAQPVDTARIAGGSPNDWLAYHQSYNGWDYSPLDQINANNVKDLEVAWIHVPGHATRGLQSMPLVADGVLYYTGSYSRVFALDGATGKQLWSYTPELEATRWSRDRRIRHTTAGAAIGEVEALCRHRRWPVDRARHENRQGGVGHQATGFPEADGRVHRRAALRQGHGGHRQPGRRMAQPKARSMASTPRPAK